MHPSPVILTVNAGSSSVKCGLFSYSSNPVSLARTVLDRGDAASVPQLFAWVDTQTERSAIAAAGHRIVHGGPLYSEPHLISPTLHDELVRLVPFAPNHLPAEIAIVDALAAQLPAVPQVACFDTAFHHTMPDVARRLPIPASYDRRGIRRYGFHGLSYAFLMGELSQVASDAARGRIVLAHLGNGSSLAAVRDGSSVDTTMGFTPIGGVVMSTRSGDLDPGVVTYMARVDNIPADRIEEILSKESGLLALSETTGDMQALLARQRDDQSAEFAVRAYVYSVVKAIGALAAALGGLDMLVFSGGIGEHAAVIRAQICGALRFLGVSLDPAANDAHAGVISQEGGRVTVRVMPTNEELMIARATYRVAAAGGPHDGER